MKITVEISDALLDDAKNMAAREGTSVSALIEQGLRLRLAFRLRKASFKGRGLSASARRLDWQKIRGLDTGSRR